MRLMLSCCVPHPSEDTTRRLLASLSKYLVINVGTDVAALRDDLVGIWLNQENNASLVCGQQSCDRLRVPFVEEDPRGVDNARAATAGCAHPGIGAWRAHFEIPRAL